MFKPITFDYQPAKSKNDGGLYNAIFTADGIIWGCDITSTSSSVTFSSGEIIVGGRVVWIDGATTVQIENPIQNGYARVKARIDLTKEATLTEIYQYETPEEFSTTTLFPDLSQEAINDTGTIYEQELVVVKIDAGNVTGITRQIGAAEIDAEKLGGKAAVLYALAADVLKNSGAQILDGSLDASGSIIAPNFRIDIADGSMWFTGGSRLFRIHYDGGNNLYFHVYNANGTSVVATPLYISAAGEVVAPTINATGALKSQGTYNRTTTAAANTHISDSASGHHFYRSTSLRSAKTNIRDITREEALAGYNLRPRSFKGINKGQDDFKQFGFIAEEVAETLKELATYGDGELNGVAYERITAILLKQNQMQKKQMEDQEERIAKLENESAAVRELLVSKGILTQEEIDGLGDKA